VSDTVSQRLRFSATKLAGLQTVDRLALQDARGWFERSYCLDTFAQAGLQKTIQQINRTKTLRQGSVRGMHYQWPPFAEAKVVSCLQGEVFDVAIDLRTGSPTFLQWHAEILSAENRRSLLIPEGFAHGFQTLSDDVEMLYFHTANYAPTSAAGVNPLAPKLAINWPLPFTEVSDQDKNLPMLLPNFEGIRI
jgi:dTDP-4-dehydrorhamnose 3,5-epimerase